MPWDFVEGRFFGLDSGGYSGAERCYNCDSKLKYLRIYKYPKSKSKYIQIEIEKKVYWCPKCKCEEVQ
jgi:hypothetical protein